MLYFPQSVVFTKATTRSARIAIRRSDMRCPWRCTLSPQHIMLNLRDFTSCGSPARLHTSRPTGHKPIRQAIITASSAVQTQDSVVALLKEAGFKKSVAPERVEAALVQLEQQSAAAPGNRAASVDGRWRLVYSSQSSIRFLQYIPVLEDLNVELAAQRLALETQLGPFTFYVKGPINAWDEATGVMAFQFKQVDIVLFGKKIWETQPATKPKTYTWFYIGQDLAAARSSAGGLALLVKGL